MRDANRTQRRAWVAAIQRRHSLPRRVAFAARKFIADNAVVLTVCAVAVLTGVAHERAYQENVTRAALRIAMSQQGAVFGPASKE